jgi:hypothetical protein
MSFEPLVNKFCFSQTDSTKRILPYFRGGIDELHQLIGKYLFNIYSNAFFECYLAGWQNSSHIGNALIQREGIWCEDAQLVFKVERWICN